MKVCGIAECTNKSRSRGWCSKHYQRWKKYGDPDYVEVVKTFSLHDALKVRTSYVGECWVWNGATTEDGYATYNGAEAAIHGTRFLHRIVWEQSYGPIPEGLEIDHLCFTRNCINTEHMQLADRYVQTRNLQGLKTNNKSGVRGVSWVEREQKYIARVKYRHKTYYCGRYDNPEDAIPALEAKRKELYGNE